MEKMNFGIDNTPNNTDVKILDKDENPIENKSENVVEILDASGRPINKESAEKIEVVDSDTEPASESSEEKLPPAPKVKKPRVKILGTKKTTKKKASKEEISDENIDIIDLLNRARQGGVEYADIYAHVFGGKSKNSGKYPQSWINRPDLIENFNISKNGNYNSTRDAAHDLIDYLADEAEEKIHTKEISDKEIEKNEEISSLKNNIDLLNKARQNSVEYADIYSHVFDGKSVRGDKYPTEWINREDLLQKFSVGKNGEAYKSTKEAAHDLIEYLANEAEARIAELSEKPLNEKSDVDSPNKEALTPNQNNEEKVTDNIETEKEKVSDAPKEDVPVTQPEQPKVKPENTPQNAPVPNIDIFRQRENVEENQEENLDDNRNNYLKAKRLRGNVFRGKLGRLFGRIMNRDDEKIDFGGKKGIRDLQEYRREYQESLSAHRTSELQVFENMMRHRLDTGAVSPEEFNFEIRQRIVELMNEEQTNIDLIAEQGIEKNRLEKMKTNWRQHPKTRLVAGALLGGAAVATGGTAVIAARTVFAGVGSYVGTEAGLERYSKIIGHKGLIHEINKAGNFVTDEGMYRHIYSLPEEDVRNEAARLRMLQVEKGVPIDALRASSYDNGRIAELILRRDNELLANEVLENNLRTENPNVNFANIVSERLNREQNQRNEAVESQVDKERLKKMARKTVAIIASGVTGWLVGGKLFSKSDAKDIALNTEASDIPLEVAKSTNHVVRSGENLWKIIDADLGSRNILSGVDVAPKTAVVDSLKDLFDKMTPAELKSLGFSSGDADLLHVGDALNLTKALENPELIAKSIIGAQNLSPEMMAQILKNNVKIASWLAEHKSELSGVYDSQMIDKVLSGSI